MLEDVIQFGNLIGKYRERLSAYVVAYNDTGKILVMQVHDEYHLPGGGIDEGENPKEAAMREAVEEAGCTIGELQYIGKANQFFPRHALNKMGSFYRGRLVADEPTRSTEDDHMPVWMTPSEFIEGNSGDFQKWAVAQAEILFQNDGAGRIHE